MDEWHGSRASVQNQILASVTKSFPEDVIPSIPISCQTTLITTSIITLTTDKKKLKKNLKAC